LPSSTDEADNSSAKLGLEPGEWMNHLFPPSSSSVPSFGWILNMVVLVVLGMLALASWNFSPQETATASRVADLQAQVDEAHAKLTALQQQLTEREESLAQTQEDLQRRIIELAEVKDQLIQHEAELDDLKSRLPPQRSSPTSLP
jgi:septal ring factor EnvC (AmiA/AmiB activator)